MNYNTLKLPKMIVFDLDMCMWSPEMYELSQCPDKPIHATYRHA